MANTNEDVANFLQVAIPDLNQEIDRICMAILEIELQRIAAAATSRGEYDAGLLELKTSVFGPPLKNLDDDLNPFYPGQNLAYFLEVRAEYWKQTQPPGYLPKPDRSQPKTVTAFRELLGAARRIQAIIGEQSSQFSAAWTEGRDQVSAQVFHAQKLTVEAVFARLSELRSV